MAHHQKFWMTNICHLYKLSGDWAKAKRQRQISKVLSTTLNFLSIISKVLSTIYIYAKAKQQQQVFSVAKAKRQLQMFSCSESEATATKRPIGTDFNHTLW